LSRTFRIRHRKQLAAARLPVMPLSKINPLAQEAMTQKELHEMYARRVRDADSYTEPQLPDIREAWPAIMTRCRELSE
jgi:hypothetical protein